MIILWNLGPLEYKEYCLFQQFKLLFVIVAVINERNKHALWKHVEYIG